MVKEGEDAEKVTSALAMEKLEATLLGKVQEIEDKIQRTENVEELQKLSSALSDLLSNLERTRKMKRG